MIRRLLLVTVCMLTLPMWCSLTSEVKSNNPTPFATIALAGHTLSGGWCECGAPGCLCDPGEEPRGQSARPVSDDSPVLRKAKHNLDLGTGAFLIGLALLLWSRLRV